MRQRYEEIRRLGAEVLVVTQARPELLAAFLRDQPQPFLVVADPTRTVYRAYGLERTTWKTVLRLRVVLRYLRLIFRGWAPRRAYQGEDVLQLGGDFVLDREGRLVYSFRSADPTDRPPFAELLQAVRSVSS